MMQDTKSHRSPRRAAGYILPTVAALLIAAAAASAQDPPTGSWSAEAGGENFLQGGCTSDGTYLYLVGGYQFGSVSDFPDYYRRLRRYDPASNSWSDLASLPVAVFSNGAAYHGGRIFSFGGSDPSAGVTNAIQAFDIGAGAWSVLGATLSTAREGLAAATLGDRIYATGGYDGNYSGDNDEFNPMNDTVTARAAMPTGVIHPTMAAVPSLGKMYAISGFNDFGPVAQNYEYTQAGDTWTARASIQNGAAEEQPRYAAASFSLMNRVYVTGGTYESPDRTTWEYNPGTDMWARRADLASARYFHGAAAIGGRGYVYGGAVLGAFTTGEEFTGPDFGPPPSSNQPPVADAGPDQSVEASGPDGASVTLDGSGSTDPDGDTLSYEWTGPFGTAGGATPSVSLPLGASTVTLTVTDPSGESSTDTVTITVEDSTPPVITGLAASPDTLWSPNHDMREVNVTVSAGDADDASPVCEIVSVSSNQDAGNESDWEITGALSCNLRAERTGGETRIYTITVRCTDASGNSSTAAVTVMVPHNQGGSGDSVQGQGKK